MSFYLPPCTLQNDSSISVLGCNGPVATGNGLWRHRGGSQCPGAQLISSSESSRPDSWRTHQLFPRENGANMRKCLTNIGNNYESDWKKNGKKPWESRDVGGFPTLCGCRSDPDQVQWRFERCLTDDQRFIPADSGIDGRTA